MITRKYRPDIDGLRAIAVLLVLIFHFNLAPIGKAGFIGVDVFFVISGYLITSIIRTELTSRTFLLSTFYLKRVKRLAPALAVTLAFVAMAGYIWLFPVDLIGLAKEILVAQTYVSNIYYWRTINYFGISVGSAFLLHTWSLAVEEQFYLFYPLLLLMLNRYLPKLFWQSIGCLLVTSFALNVILLPLKPEAVFYLFPTRAWELLIGAITVVASESMRGCSRLRTEVTCLLGLGLIFLSVLFYSREFRFPGYFALIPTVGAAAVILAGSVRSTSVGRVIAYPIATYVGKISYPLYLVHWPIHIFASRLMGDDYGLVSRIYMFMLSLAGASAIFEFVEKPIRRGTFLHHDASLLKLYGASITICVGGFIAILATSGLPQRYPTEVARLAAFAADKPAPLTECLYVGQRLSSASEFCSIGDRSSQPTWMIYGDSHAWAAYGAIDNWLSLEGLSGLFIFRHSCPPLDGIHLFRDPLCFGFNERVLDFIEKAHQVRNVLLVSAWHQVPEGILSKSENNLPTKDGSFALFRDTFARTVSRIHDAGVRVFIWEPVPGAKKDVPTTLAEALYYNRPPDLEFSRDEYEKEFAFFFEALEHNRSLIDGTVSPSNSLCKLGMCSVEIDGNPAYFDNAHLAASNSDFWAKVLQASISHAR